jgi:hypothetical protein
MRKKKYGNTYADVHGPLYPEPGAAQDEGNVEKHAIKSMIIPHVMQGEIMQGKNAANHKGNDHDFCPLFMVGHDLPFTSI